MEAGPGPEERIEVRVTQLFAMVSEALAGATEALLGNDVAIGLAVVEGDQAVDDLTAEVELLVWPQLDVEGTPTSVLRHLVASSSFCRSSKEAGIWPSTSPSAP